MRLIGYVRVSRVAGRDGDSFISPSVQRERIEAQAKAGGHKLVDVLTDLDQPGSKYERPAFQNALAMVERGEVDGVIVYALDRFARSLPDAVAALDRLEAAGGVLVSVRDSLDTSTPTGRFARTLMLALAQLELERIRDNWAVATERAIARGVHITRVPPLGYRKLEDGRLEPDPKAAPVVRQVFLKRAEGTSWLELGRFLDAKLPKPDGGCWPRQSVSSLVKNRAYLGEAFAGDLVNPKAHQPLVSRAEWEAAQSPATVRNPRESKLEPALLAGLLTCATCGHVLSRRGTGAKGPWANYNCRVRHADGECKAPAKISERRADAFVESAFLEWLHGQPVLAESVESTTDREAATAKLEAAEEELIAYRDANLVSVIGKAAYTDGLRSRAAIVEQTRNDLAALNGHATPLVRADLAESWPELSVEERRTILASVIERVEVGRGGKAAKLADRVKLAWRH
jgi:site-specific DNA recombinase